MGSVVQEPVPFEEALVHEPELALLEVPEAAMDEFRGLGGGARGEVAPLDERGAVAACRRVERHAGAGHPAADHEHVELLGRQPVEGESAVERRVGMVDCRHRREPATAHR